MLQKNPSVCVFCGSRNGADPAYAQAARDLGQLIARRGWRLVYGAGDVGMMGEVASATAQGGGDSLGVIPVHLLTRERESRDISRLVITENMHERKKVMFMNADAIITLPGGAGSLDELFEVLTWRQLGLHEKPVFLLNVNGYWDPLLHLIDHMIAQGFVGREFLGYFTTSASVAELEPLLATALEARHPASE